MLPDLGCSGINCANFPSVHLFVANVDCQILLSAQLITEEGCGPESIRHPQLEANPKDTTSTVRLSAQSLDHMDSASGHDGPKINGSTAAFYAVIIVLSLVISVAFAAVVYLVLEERAHRRSEGRHNHIHRPIGDESGQDPSYQPPTRWYNRIFRFRSIESEARARDVGTSRRAQGWIQAGTTDEWEPEPKSRALPASPTREYNSPPTTRRSSATYFPQARSLVHSFISDRSSIVPSGVPAMPYEDPHAPSVRNSIPSMYSQLLPPSSRTTFHPTHQPNWSISSVSATPVRISTTPRMPSSPVSIEYAPSESHEGSDMSEISQKPSLRTFEGGTKFIEAL